MKQYKQRLKLHKAAVHAVRNTSLPLHKNTEMYKDVTATRNNKVET